MFEEKELEHKIIKIIIIANGWIVKMGNSFQYFGDEKRLAEFIKNSLVDKE